MLTSVRCALINLTKCNAVFQLSTERNAIKRKQDLFSLKRSASCTKAKHTLLKRFATTARAEVAQLALQIAECPPLVFPASLLDAQP